MLRRRTFKSFSTSRTATHKYGVVVKKFITADMRLGITFGITKFGIPNFDSFNFCSVTNLPAVAKVPQVQMLTESKFVIPNFHYKC
jgi:hypothetical protein